MSAPAKHTSGAPLPQIKPLVGQVALKFLDDAEYGTAAPGRMDWPASHEEALAAFHDLRALIARCERAEEEKDNAIRRANDLLAIVSSGGRSGTALADDNKRLASRLRASAAKLSEVTRLADGLAEALGAADARIRGEYDNPGLLDFGPLSDSTLADAHAIIRAALRAWNERGDK